MEKKACSSSSRDQTSYLKAGETRSKLAEEYGIGRATVTGIKNSETKLQSFASTMESMAMKKGCKVMRTADDKPSTFGLP